MLTTNYIFYQIAAILAMIIIVVSTRKPVRVFIEAAVSKGFAKFITNIISLMFIAAGLKAATKVVTVNSRFGQIPILDGIIKGFANTLSESVVYIIHIIYFGFAFAFLYWLYTRFTKKAELKDFFTKLDNADLDVDVPKVAVQIQRRETETQTSETPQEEPSSESKENES